MLPLMRRWSAAVQIPAMAAGVIGKLWSIADMMKVIEDRETKISGEPMAGRNEHRSTIRFRMA
jgi:hypothetical protein